MQRSRVSIRELVNDVALAQCTLFLCRFCSWGECQRDCYRSCLRWNRKKTPSRSRSGLAELCNGDTEILNTVIAGNQDTIVTVEIIPETKESKADPMQRQNHVHRFLSLLWDGTRVRPTRYRHDQRRPRGYHPSPWWCLEKETSKRVGKENREAPSWQGTSPFFPSDSSFLADHNIHLLSQATYSPDITHLRLLTLPQTGNVAERDPVWIARRHCAEPNCRTSFCSQRALHEMFLTMAGPLGEVCVLKRIRVSDPQKSYCFFSSDQCSILFEQTSYK